MNKIKLGEIANITKLAGFEHTKFIQGNCTHSKVNVDDIPLFIGKTVRNGKIDNNFDWYIPKSISEELPRSQLRKKCIICPYVGSLGDLAIFEGKYEAHLGSNIAKIELVDNKKYTEEFLYYYLKSPYGNSLLLKDTQGAVQKNITMEAIRNVILPNIDYKLQSKISSILKFLDDKIELNNKINSELEAMAKTIYDYWFLQFEFPNEEGKPYKSSGGKMVWNEELKREIPEGWEVSSIGNILSSVPSSIKKLKKEYLNKGKFPIIDQSSAYISGFTNDEKAILFIKDAIVFGDHTKIVKYINFNFCRGADGTQIILSNKNNLSNILLYYQIKNLELVSQGYSRYFKFLKEKLIVIPDTKTNRNFEKIVEKLYQKIKINIFENQELTSLRDFLLPLLMNGQVGFKEE